MGLWLIFTDADVHVSAYVDCMHMDSQPNRISFYYWAKKSSGFRKPYQLFVFGAYSNFLRTSAMFSIFRVFLMILMFFLIYKKSFSKKFPETSPNPDLEILLSR